MPGTDLDFFKRILVAGFPEENFGESSFVLHTRGYDSLAVDVADRWIFKFPREAEDAEALRKEARILDIVRPAVSMPVPALTMHHVDEPPLSFSRHEKLRGEHLLDDDYAVLSDTAREALAHDIARFYAELHALDRATLEAAGAGPIAPWLEADEMLRQALPTLPGDLHRVARDAIEAYRRLPPDPHGTTYGFFDGHGWNMAFDHARGRLNGIYDFGDSGFGPLHQEFVYASFISTDLSERIARAYETRTGRDLDRTRIALLTGIFWLSELGGMANDPAPLTDALVKVERWARDWGRR